MLLGDGNTTIVVRKAFSDARMYDYQHFASLLDDASRSDEQVEVRCLDQTDLMLMPPNGFTGYLQSRPDMEKDLYASTARSLLKAMLVSFNTISSPGAFEEPISIP